MKLLFTPRQVCCQKQIIFEKIRTSHFLKNVHLNFFMWSKLFQKKESPPKRNLTIINYHDIIFSSDVLADAKKLLSFLHEMEESPLVFIEIVLNDRLKIYNR